ncbi:MAG: hypothetical protein PHT07_15360 [Paludibacter sp.]|nr:hypothetical protein [Paludibacter sp.]
MKQQIKIIYDKCQNELNNFFKKRDIFLQKYGTFTPNDKIRGRYKGAIYLEGTKRLDKEYENMIKKHRRLKRAALKKYDPVGYKKLSEEVDKGLGIK